MTTWVPRLNPVGRCRIGPNLSAMIVPTRAQKKVMRPTASAPLAVVRVRSAPRQGALTTETLTAKPPPRRAGECARPVAIDQIAGSQGERTPRRNSRQC